MTLTTHAIVGASLAQFFPNQPVVAFGVGFVAHLVCDTIPHRDYELGSLVKDKENKLNSRMILGRNFVIDLFKIGFDILLGFVVCYLLYIYKTSSPAILATFAGMVGGIIPDFFSFVYLKIYRGALIRWFTDLHFSIQHEDKKALGVLTQVGVVTLALSAVFLFR